MGSKPPPAAVHSLVVEGTRVDLLVGNFLELVGNLLELVGNLLELVGILPELVGILLGLAGTLLAVVDMGSSWFTKFLKQSK